MLVIYENTEDNNKIIEQHKIRNGKPGAACPVSKDTINTLALSLKNSGSNCILNVGLDNRIVATKVTNTDATVIWKAEATHQEYLFDSAMELLSGEYPSPNFLYIYDYDNNNIANGDLRVYAYVGPLTAETKLYKAPLPNLQNTFCFGAAEINLKKSDSSASKIIDAVTEAVWSSAFTEYRAYERSYFLAAQNNQPITEDKLIPFSLPCTLTSILKEKGIQ